MKKKDLLNLILLITVVSFATYKYLNKEFHYQKSAFLMDTLVDIKIVTHNKNSESLIDSTFKLVERLDKKFSFYNDESEIGKFNSNQIDYLFFDKDFTEIFRIADSLYVFSNSLFDVTIGDLTELWRGHIPAEDSIQMMKKKTGFYKLQFQNGKVKKPAEMKINLGSLAKGYIVDEAVKYLMKNFAESGFVNAGGDMRIFGSKIKIGIQHPRNKKSELVGVLKIENKAVVTSGDYERYFIKDGVRYHHIINPKTGYPANCNISVTVIANSALVADAYSTALFLMETNAGIKLAENVENLEALIIFEEENILKAKSTNGFEQYLESWSATDIEFN